MSEYEQEVNRCDPEAEKLIRAASKGTIQDVVSQLKGKLNLLKSEDGSGRTALHFAAYLDRVDVIELLLTDAYRPHLDVDHEDFDGNTPLVLAVKQRNERSVQCLLEVGKADIAKPLNRNVTALHHAACVSNNIPVLKRLLLHGGEEAMKKIFTDVVDGGTPLHWACHCNDIINIAYFLDDLHLPIDVLDAHGGTPLFVAVFLKNIDVVRFLLERGANLRVVTQDHSTVLQHAVEEVKDVELIKLLLSFTRSKENPPFPQSDVKTIQAELNKELNSDEKNKELCERFKKQGNQVFSEGEYMKAVRYYTLSISHDCGNHVLFSNRSACYFNLGQYRRALADGCHCIALAPQWAKGYFRVAAARMELGENEECLTVCKKGLSLDSTYTELKQVFERCQKKST